MKVNVVFSDDATQRQHVEREMPARIEALTMSSRDADKQPNTFFSKKVGIGSRLQVDCLLSLPILKRSSSVIGLIFWRLGSFWGGYGGAWDVGRGGNGGYYPLPNANNLIKKNQANSSHFEFDAALRKSFIGAGCNR